MEQYPNYRTYQRLYAKYFFGRDISELLDLLGPLQNKHVLDLCCGEGKLAEEALLRGAASVTLVDQEPRMVSESMYEHPRAKVFTTGVWPALSALRSTRTYFDGIVCRQGVNYWLSDVTAHQVSTILNEAGVFAFNTFNQKPEAKPRVLEYELDDHNFVEVSWLVGNVVHHVQVRDGMEPHHTEFLWLAPETIRGFLEPYFAVTEEIRGKTSIYRCIKK